MNKDLHTNPKNQDFGYDIARQISIPYTKTKEDVWNEMDSFLMKSAAEKGKKRTLRYFISAAAAVLALLFSVSLALILNKENILNDTGAVLTLNLPDHSEVVLNHNARIEYQPLLWFAARELTLEGEAFFNVSQGNTFRVRSVLGTTQVVGTKFTIQSFETLYQVSCIEGSVAVSTPKDEVILMADDLARTNKSGLLELIHDYDPQQSMAWQEDEWLFKSAPLKEVIAILAAYYQIQIDLQIADELSYSGSFKRSLEPGQALNIICKPFGLTFVVKDDHSYLIHK